MQVQCDAGGGMLRRSRMREGRPAQPPRSSVVAGSSSVGSSRGSPNPLTKTSGHRLSSISDRVRPLDVAEQPVVAQAEQPDHREAEGEPADLGKGVSELLA